MQSFTANTSISSTSNTCILRAEKGYLLVLEMKRTVLVLICVSVIY
ncbi:MAG: hypothetical protein FWE25_00375 [Lachnospiraceae bacterium]|nr:hypothetical protein [Lachnospiraceae bacterium]